MPQENRSEDAPALPPLVKIVAFLGMSEVEFAVLGALEFASAELAVDLLCDAGDEDSFESSPVTAESGCLVWLMLLPAGWFLSFAASLLELPLPWSAFCQFLLPLTFDRLTPPEALVVTV